VTKRWFNVFWPKHLAHMMFLAVTLTENDVLKGIYGEEKASLKQQLQLKRALNDDQKVKLHNF
jgi:hypothetical protein